jgi:hypothetical protein
MYVANASSLMKTPPKPQTADRKTGNAGYRGRYIAALTEDTPRKPIATDGAALSFG